MRSSFLLLILICLGCAKDGYNVFNEIDDNSYRAGIRIPSPDNAHGKEIIFPGWLKIGGKIPEHIEKRNKNKRELRFFFSNWFYKPHKVKIEDIEIEVLTIPRTINSTDSRVIEGILIYSEKIEIDGVRVGNTFGEIKRKFELRKIASIEGFGHIIRLKSGWSAVLFEGDTLGEKLQDITKVHALALGGKSTYLR